MTYQSVTLECADAVVRPTLDRLDKLNSLTRDMLAELAIALDEVAADFTLCVLVLTGRSRAFSAGHDLTAAGAR